MILIRYILISLIGYLIVRSLIYYGVDRKTSSDLNKTAKKNNGSTKKVSKNVGEYIDYEEIKK